MGRNLLQKSNFLTLPKLVLLLVTLFPLLSKAQTNLAPSATVAHGNGGSGPYSAANYNDGVMIAEPYGWVNGNSWIEYTWATAKTLTKITWHHADRPMTSCVIQYWNGTSYVNIQTYTAKSTTSETLELTSPATTTKIRFNNITNASISPNFREIQVFGFEDTTAPTGTLSINGGDAKSLSADVSLSITSSDGTGSNVSGVTHMRFSNDNTTWSTWESIATSKNWQLSSGEGDKTVYMQVRDAAANVSTTTIKDEISLDLGPPAVVSINRQTPSSADATKSTSVSFRVTFSKAVTGVDADDFTLTNSASANGTIAYLSANSTSVYDVTVNSISGAGTLRLDLNASGTGIKDLTDKAIEAGFTAGQLFTIDQVAPATSTGLAATAGNKKTELSWTANTETDLSSYKVYGGTAANPITLLHTIPAGTTQYSHTGLTNGTTYYYRITATDIAGNESTATADVTTVPQASQTITFNAIAAKTYGNADFNPGATASSELTISYTSDNASVAAIIDGKIHITGAGTATITATQAGTAAFIAATPQTQLLTVNKKDITVALNAVPAISKTYDGSTDASLVAGNYTLTGIESGDVVTVSGTGVYSNKSTGSAKTVTASNLVLAGADKDNYNLTTTSASTTGAIIAKEITLSLNAEPLVSKVYNGTTSATLAADNYNLTGLEHSDIVTVTGTATYTDKHAGSGKLVTANSFVLAGAQKDNYNLITTSATTTGEVTKKAITLTLDATPAITKVYDGTNSATLASDNYNLIGLESHDEVTVTGTAAYDNKNAATGKTVTANDLVIAGTDKDSYKLTTTTATTTGVIATKTLTVTADDKTKFQNTSNPVFTVSYSGFVKEENEGNLQVGATATTTAVQNSSLGTYPITVSGAVAANYNFDYEEGTLTIVPGAPTSVSLTTITVHENQAAGTLAGTLSSTSDDPSATFTYSLISGNGSTDNGLFTISGNEIRTTASLNFEQKASYAVRVRSTTQHNLSLDKELLITITDVNEQPTIADIADQTICYTTANQTINLTGITVGPDAGQSTTLSVSSTNSALFASLEVSQATNGNAELSYRISNGATGTATVTILVQDNGNTANGGVNMISKSFTITVNALPVISINSSIGTTLSKGQTAELTAASTGTYQWASAFGIISGQNTATLTVRPEETTTYTVTVTNANGCSSEQSITMVVNADYEVVKGTNIISPNGDGINDKFIIKNIDMYPKNEVKIFDRAGRLLYSQQNYTDQWDGTLNGSPLAEDTYYYVVDFGPTIPRIKGFITIVKD